MTALALPPVLHADTSAAARRDSLRRGLARGDSLVLPGIYDALTAVLAQNAGFGALYLTGAGLSNSQLGAPDVGLLSFDMIATQALRICAATTVPLIVDIDTGFGGPTSVMHAVRTLETIGVAGIQLEDQSMPKRCGHFSGKDVISMGSMQAKVEAATRARSDDNFIIIARTDAVAVNGLEDGVRRARGYADAGADVLFVEAPASADDVRHIPTALPGIPLLLNLVPGGVTPDFSVAEVAGMGYQLILHANLVLRSVMKAAADILSHLHETGESASREADFATWEQRQLVVRLEDFDAVEDDLRQRWETVETRAHG
ncbi:MAG: isocitrate lyase/PEP mutase family protein [Mycobacteriales bacterium]